MNVGLNLLHLVPEETGGSELYARRLTAALLERSPELRLTLFATPASAPSLRREAWGDELEIVPLNVDPRNRLKRVLGEQTLLPRAVRGVGVELLHNMFSTAPAAPGVPQVTTILDVIYKRFPEAHAGLLGKGLGALVWTSARRSERILTLSEAAKTDIVRFLSVPAERVDVAYLGPGLPPVEAASEADLRDQLELGEAPIVLTVSAKRPHKNLERLFEAFAEVPGDPVLVVPGYETFYEEKLRERAGERIIFTGWLEDAVLAGLYESAACFVFPSLAEGFGLPVLDAMVRGVPVACSNASSLPEVAGDAALYFDPSDTGAIAAAIQRLLDDGDLRNRLREAGRAQARKFDWAETAARTVESYERALATARS